jgi:branched-chain amino acid transport system substrate-binding protein
MRTVISRNHLRFISAILATLFLLFCGRREQSVRVGVVLPLSGSMAEYGQNAKNGITLALDDIKAKPNAPQLDLIYQDSREAPQETVDAVRRLIDVNGARFIVGGLTSSGVLAAAPYAEARGAIFFTPAASAPGIPEIGKHVFRNWPADDAIARKFGGFAATVLRARRIAILCVANDYGKVNAEAFAEGLRAHGGEVVLSHSFPQGSTDFRALIAQSRAIVALDRIFVVAYPDEYRAFFQQLSASGGNAANVLVSDTFYSPNLARNLGSTAEGAVCAVAAKPAQDYEPRRRFFAEYRAKFGGRDPGLVADTSYDAVMLLADAIAHTDGSPDAVSTWLLRNVQAYPGAAGPTTFSAIGDVTGDLAVYQLNGAEFKLMRQ